MKRIIEIKIGGRNVKVVCREGALVEIEGLEKALEKKVDCKIKYGKIVRYNPYYCVEVTECIEIEDLIVLFPNMGRKIENKLGEEREWWLED